MNAFIYALLAFSCATNVGVNAQAYCNWNNCNGQVQGGDWCNASEDQCLSCGGSVSWCEPTPAPATYCNWNNCDGQVQGGDWCNKNEERCLSCGGNVSWCTSGLPLPTVSAEDIIVRVVIPRSDDLDDVVVHEIEEARDEMTRRRNLSNGAQRRLDPSWCDRVCRSWPYPKCQIWQRQCYDHRRLRRELQSGDAYDITNELRQVAGGVCDVEKQLVLSAMIGAVTTDSEREVLEESELECFELR